MLLDQDECSQLMALQHALIALLWETRLIRQLVILDEVLTWFAACHPVWRHHVNPHLWRRLAVCRECFSPLSLADDRQYVWWHAGMRFTDCQQIALWCVWAALDSEHRHIFRRSTFYRCSQKSDYLQGHVAHHMCFKKWCGQVCKVHLNNKSSHLTTCHCDRPPSTFVQLQGSSASVFSCQIRQVDGLFWQRTSVSPLHASRDNCVCNQDTCAAAPFGQKSGFPAGLGRQTHLGARSNNWAVK